MHLLLSLLFSFSIFAHQSSLNSGGQKIRWPVNSIPLAINTNTSDLSSTVTRNIIIDSINEWNNASVAQIRVSNASSNQVSFSSDFSIYGSAVLGVTQLNYNSSGNIQTASIFLNDNYSFAATPGLYAAGQVYLGDVVTHELGHFLGLAHSEVLDSSMFYSSFSGQYSIAADDAAGIRHKYSSSYGVISGYIKGGSNVGVLGSQIQAISAKTGKAIAAISDEDGYFEIGGLDLDDTYYLYSSPTKNSESLPSYFANIQTEFCPASYVGSFYTACGNENDGYPQGITLTSQNSSVDVGTVTINCSLKSDLDYNYEKLQSSFTPLEIYNYSNDQKTEKAFVGFFHSTSSTSWSNDDVLEVDLSSFPVVTTNKVVKFNLISYPFGDQLEYEMDIEQNGVLVDQQDMDYSFITQTFNPDLEARIPLDTITSNNVFKISIRSKKLTNFYVAQTFPSSSIFVSQTHMPYLLVMSVWDSTGGELSSLNSGEVNLSDNASCLDAPFTYAVSRSIASDEASTDAVTASPTCGTIDPPGGNGPTSLMLFCFGFLLTLLAQVVFKSRKNFLS